MDIMLDMVESNVNMLDMVKSNVNMLDVRKRQCSFKASKRTIFLTRWKINCSFQASKHVGQGGRVIALSTHLN